MDIQVDIERISLQGHYGKRVPRWARLMAGCVGACLLMTRPKALADLDRRDKERRRAAKKAQDANGNNNLPASPKVSYRLRRLSKRSKGS